MKALVVGCGDVGTRLGLAWAAAGCEVFGVRRSAAPLPAPIHTVSGDVRDSGTYDALPSDLDHVVYAVAARPPGDEGAYRPAYVDGVRAVLLVPGPDSPERPGSWGLTALLVAAVARRVLPGVPI
ncbi:MAG: hypothetical protein ACO4CZ_02325, partial [Planctomycetota bacterium]